jgi:hypothetical protein
MINLNMQKCRYESLVEVESNDQEECRENKMCVKWQLYSRISSTTAVLTWRPISTQSSLILDVSAFWPLSNFTTIQMRISFVAKANWLYK